MWIVKTDRNLKLKDGAPFIRGMSYVVNRAQLEALKDTGAISSFSSFNCYHERPVPPSGAAPNVLLYRHAAFGDQLIATAIARYVKATWPDCRLDIATSAHVASLWTGLADSAISIPMPLEAVRSYDWHLFYDEMFESNSHPDQGNGYDDFYRWIGIRPETVADEFKRPWVQILDSDYRLYRGFQPHLQPGRYLVYQLQASNPVRTYPPELAAQFIRRWVAERPDWPVVIVGQNERQKNRAFPNESRDELSVLLDGIRGHGGTVANLVGETKGFRETFPIVANAGLVVCPDSSIGHLAAAFPAVPVVSLWGAFAPNDRVRYYANHHPLTGHRACPHAPCRSHLFTLPRWQCREAAGNWHLPDAGYCNALASITPDAIFEAANRLTK
jgi:ADP-heptose:LPS heptosyltransferase